MPPFEESFRTLEPAQSAEIPPRIRLLLHKAQSFQIALEKMHEGRNPARHLITRDLGCNQARSIEWNAAQIRECRDVSFDRQTEWGSAETALSERRKALFDVGIYAFKDQFREPGYSCFCLCDNEFPIICVNNSTARAWQIFTLFHELAHLLFRTSGVDANSDEFVDRISRENRRIEVVGNGLAARILVPPDWFDEAITDLPPNRVSALQLAERFSMSREFEYRNSKIED